MPKMSSRMWYKVKSVLGAIMLLWNTVSSTPAEKSVQNLTLAQWDADAPSSLTVKKSSLSNVDDAVVLTRKQEEEIVDRHNLLRQVAQPTATNMRKMSWDKELASIATAYSRKCIYEHNKQRKHSRFRYIGENLYISTGIPMNTALLTNAVWAWDNEKHDYDYESRKCEPGKKCGHYTQIVWDDTFKVGCGVTICSAVNVHGKTWYHATLFACNYGPGGNYDRHPFVSGPSCSGCHEHDECEENLCTNPIRDITSKRRIEASWNEWSPWSTCSKTCAGGMARRERICNTFVEGDCEGYAREITYTCSPNLCGLSPLGPGGGGDSEVFLPWGQWSECSQTCGMGITVRKRQCKRGLSCSGINRLTSSCNKGECGAPSVRGWSQWGSWGVCSSSCGAGIQKRKRSCMQVSRCPGNKETKKRCNTEPCKLPARWSDWSTWSVCTASCGGGSKSKSRRCLTGTDCEGATKSTEACNTDRCPGKWSSWSKWGECSVTCGPGTRSKSRFCIGDGKCSGSTSENENCNTGECPVFGPWSAWSDCDVTCGSGNRVRTRVCSTLNEDDCMGESVSAVSCNMQKCLTSGWSPWGPWKPCSVTCGGGEKSSQRTCNLGDSKAPSCEGAPIRMRSCKMEKCPEFTEWSEWSPCDVTCGEGSRTRSRRCDTIRGKGCIGSKNEVSTCNLAACTKSIWKPWTPWTRCSKTCGEGKQTRRRKCVVGNTGPPCIGINDEVKSCVEKMCFEKDPPNKGPGERNNDQGPEGGAVGKVPSMMLLFIIYTAGLVFTAINLL